MDGSEIIQKINSLSLYADVLKKLTVKPQSLSDKEKVYILTCAIILIKKYEKDNRYTSYLQLAYYIILKYSLCFDDYEPLYDFSVNIGFYPIAQAITSNNLIKFESISFSLLSTQIDNNFKRGDLIETLEQKLARDKILASKENEICFIAPTSFGKSSLIIDHIKEHWETAKRIAIIVPSKSLLMQTYRSVQKRKFGVKILIHDEMFNGEERFIGVFTQERALRLLDKNAICFDILYIDEAHRLFERDSRSVLLSRLIKLNRKRNHNTKILYLSPLITDTNNLKFSDQQNIFEQRIKFNVKEPEYYEYRTTGQIYKYNPYLNKFFKIGCCSDMFQYMEKYKTKKTFYYINSPKKIEQFAKNLAENCNSIQLSDNLTEIIENLKKYIHEDFYAIEYLKKGIIYLHGKLPDNVKEYLEFKFSQLSEIQFLIANKVILEGINLPIDSIFILSGTYLHEKELTNLIGRVNRLDQVFGVENNLRKLIPQVHFVNSDEYNRVHSKFENKIKKLRKFVFPDKIENPLLENYNPIRDKKFNKKKYETIIADETAFFTEPENDIQKLKQKMLALGMNSIYEISDDLCECVLKQIKYFQNSTEIWDIHFLDRLQAIFIEDLHRNIIDDEFERLKNDEAIEYYKMFFKNRKKSLKENITLEVQYFERRVKKGYRLLFVGKTYGEIPYPNTNRASSQNVYVDLSTKTKQQMVNIAIVKQKMEGDFINYKLNMFFQLMFDYELLTKEEYNMIIYGTADDKKLYLVKMGLTINIINRLVEDDQLSNITIDDNGNLIVNEEFESYKQNADDFYRFELNRFL